MRSYTFPSMPSVMDTLGFTSASTDPLSLSLGSYGAPVVPPPGPMPSAISSSGTVGDPMALVNSTLSSLKNYGTSWDNRNALGQTLFHEDGGLNLGNIGSLVQSLGAFGQLYAGFEANKLAKKSLGLQREAYAENLKATKTTFNKSLSDQAHARAAQGGWSDSRRDDYIQRYTLT